MKPRPNLTFRPGAGAPPGLLHCVVAAAGRLAKRARVTFQRFDRLDLELHPDVRTVESPLADEIDGVLISVDDSPSWTLLMSQESEIVAVDANERRLRIPFAVSPETFDAWEPRASCRILFRPDAVGRRTRMMVSIASELRARGARFSLVWLGSNGSPPELADTSVESHSRPSAAEWSRLVTTSSLVLEPCAEGGRPSVEAVAASCLGVPVLASCFLAGLLPNALAVEERSTDAWADAILSSGAHRPQPASARFEECCQAFEEMLGL